jgi:hypothetical protein
VSRGIFCRSHGVLKPLLSTGLGGKTLLAEGTDSLTPSLSHPASTQNSPCLTHTVHRTMHSAIIHRIEVPPVPHPPPHPPPKSTRHIVAVWKTGARVGDREQNENGSGTDQEPTHAWVE